MFDRTLSPRVAEALLDTPVVLLLGARQVGKSTLAKALLAHQAQGRYLTLDDPAVRRAAEVDPVGFVAQQRGLTVLDEIQLAPQLFRTIKAEVDAERKPGRFLLTGSANVLVLPQVSESLAGRMEVITLDGLSQYEVAGSGGNLVDRLFSDRPLEPQNLDLDREALIGAILAGGFPEAREREPGRRRSQWFESYVQTLLQRDIRDLSRIEGLTQLPRILELLSVRSASLLNMAELSRSLGIPLNTLKRYLALLEAVFLLATVPAWSSNLGKRLVKAPKLMLRDTGLLAHMMGADAGRLARDPDLLGGPLETFVAGELRKLLGWAECRARLFHYRTLPGAEVDLLLEHADGRVLGVEVKASGALQAKDFRGLKGLAGSLGEAFHGGIVLYTGREVLPFGPKLHAVPVSALWQGLA
ncbi:ATP-binding protein [Geothrix sp. 21YS21S-2]|uniref:ATP-binding protein n=1 Tax=Geothrix sp. 21YS21S-2 TaxID=3068893 RepID=UPI0027B8FCEB|nr:ATP-binding protein [Geothrix sp. 21YS21S-2]